jgi:hypothetical protein
MLALFQAPQTSETMRAQAGDWLRIRLSELDRAQNAGLLGYNVARASAWATLNGVRETLPTFQRDSSTAYYCSYDARLNGYGG